MDHKGMCTVAYPALHALTSLKIADVRHADARIVFVPESGCCTRMALVSAEVMYDSTDSEKKETSGGEKLFRAYIVASKPGL